MVDEGSSATIALSQSSEMIARLVDSRSSISGNSRLARLDRWEPWLILLIATLLLYLTPGKWYDLHPETDIFIEYLVNYN